MYVSLCHILVPEYTPENLGHPNFSEREDRDRSSLSLTKA